MRGRAIVPAAGLLAGWTRWKADSPEPQRVRAEEAYVEAVKLLPKVEDQRVGRRLRIKLVQVPENLEHLQAAGGSRAHAAYR